MNQDLNEYTTLQLMDEIIERLDGIKFQSVAEVRPFLQERVDHISSLMSTIPEEQKSLFVQRREAELEKYKNNQSPLDKA